MLPKHFVRLAYVFEIGCQMSGILRHQQAERFTEDAITIWCREPGEFGYQFGRIGHMLGHFKANHKIKFARIVGAEALDGQIPSFESRLGEPRAITVVVVIKNIETRSEERRVGKEC